MELDSNQLSGVLPFALLGLEDTLDNLALRDSGCLESDDPELTAFLDHCDPDWSVPNGSVPCM